MIKTKQYKAFSLAETLIAITIIGILIAISVPFITKMFIKAESLQKDSQGFYYKNNSTEDALGYCVETKLNKDGDIILEDSKNCSVDEFKVPKNVSFIDLTLVAGGGGGGGAAGGTTYTYHDGSIKSRKPMIQYCLTEECGLGDDVETTCGASDYSSCKYFSSELFKNYKINLMTGTGGNAASSIGGASSQAIVDYDLTREHLFDYAEMFYFPQHFLRAGMYVSKTEGKQSSPMLAFYYHPTTQRESDASNITGPQNMYLDILPYDETPNVLGETMHSIIVKSGAVSNKDFICKKLVKWDNSCKTDLDSCTSYYNCDLIPYQNKLKQNSTTTKIGSRIPRAGELGAGADAPGGTPGQYHFDADLTVEYAPNIGAGGVGGTAIKLKNFPVIPEKTYKIYVGSGGSGGAKGTLGKIGSIKKIKCPDGTFGCANINAFNNSETSGQNGTGGTSTAIYDENNNLVLMVLGGAGGNGGVKKATMYKLINNSSLPSMKHYQVINHLLGFSGSVIFKSETLPTRQFPIVIVGRNYVDRINNLVDKSYIESIEENAPTGYKLLGSNPASGDFTIDLATMTPSLIRYTYTYIPENNNQKKENDRYLDKAVRALNYWPRTTAGITEQEQIIEKKKKKRGKIYGKIEYIRDQSGTGSFKHAALPDIASEDGKIGGFLDFSDFYNKTSGTFTFADDQTYADANGTKDRSYPFIKNSMINNNGGVGSNVEIYHGFYMRYLDGVDQMYAGGLGGFSGLGTKAGCGGGFVGNKDGKYLDEVDSGLTVVDSAVSPKYSVDFNGKRIKYASNYVNTFIAGLRNDNDNETPTMYHVSNYYDNCTLDSPDGQTARFIAPQVSEARGEAIGQAGSGGGGGGWSTKYGAGSGGDGQDGYVFITWKKR